MTKFEWTDADRAKLVPGVFVRVVNLSFCSRPDGEYVVHRVDPPGGVWVLNGDLGVSLECHVDPASIRPNLQLDLFGGDK